MKLIRAWLIEYLDDLRLSRFYGRITLEFREGNLFLVRKEETVKPPEAVDQKRS